MQRGLINNRNYAAQIRDFTGLQFGNIAPTDIDGLIEYKNKCFIFIETKFRDTELPFGQKLAITRLCDELNKPAIFIVSEHNTNGDIDLAKTIVREYYYKNNWITPKKENINLREAIDKFISMIEQNYDH